MKRLLTCLVGVFAIGLITSCSTLSDEDVKPVQSKISSEKFEVELTKGGSEPDPGDPGRD